MSNLKDIVEQVQETPTPRCWESIASQLPAAGTAIGGGTAATAAKGTIAAGKLAAIIGSTAAVVTVVTVTTVSLLKNDSVTENQLTSDNSTQIIISDSISTDDTETFLVESESATQKTHLNSSAADKPSDKADPVVINSSTPASSTETTPTPPNNISKTPTTSTSSSANLVSAPSPIPSTNMQNAVAQDNTVNTNFQTSQSNNKPKESTDKAEENHPETNINPEDFDYSRPIIIEIPNIFTPNGDGKNDHFVINGLEQCDKRMLMVKDQKGQTVFQSSQYDNSWDGANLPDGTYYYQFMYSINNINEVRKGMVLIRR